MIISDNLQQIVSRLGTQVVHTARSPSGGRYVRSPLLDVPD